MGGGEKQKGGSGRDRESPTHRVSTGETGTWAAALLGGRPEALTEGSQRAEPAKVKWFRSRDRGLLAVHLEPPDRGIRRGLGAPSRLPQTKAVAQVPETEVSALQLVATPTSRTSE